MAWVIITDGISFEVKVPDGKINFAETELTSAIKEISNRAGNDGLHCRIDCDNENDCITVVIGKEIMDGRHIIKGETITVVPNKDAALTAKIQQYSREAKQAIEAKYSTGDEIIGISINHFD